MGHNKMALEILKIYKSQKITASLFNKREKNTDI